MAVSERVTAVTAIFGFNENSSTGGKAKNSAIPEVPGAPFDGWFHGDFRQSWPSTRTSALGSKTLNEYPNSTFPNYRVKNGLRISLQTSGNTVTADPSVTYDRSLSPITLEGESGEFNPFRQDFGTLDGSANFLSANEVGRFETRKRVGPINGVEGARVSSILGGNDTYLLKAKNVLGLALGAISGGSGSIPKLFYDYYLELPAFYTFIDFVLMADGAKLVRVWDASAYPAQSLYVGESRVDTTNFRENIEWTREGYSLDSAFAKFTNDALYPDRTPFRILSELNYANTFKSGSGLHPVMDFATSGTTLSVSTLESKFSSPLVPPLL